jgi:hypothetical protein
MSYVLVERHANYNDEYMYMEEGDSGVPVCVTVSKDKAIECLDSFTKDHLRGFDIGSWCCSPEDIGLPESEEELAKLQITGSYSDMIISKDVTDENLDKIINCLTLEFFKLFKIDDSTGKVTIYSKRRKIFR